MGLPPQVARWVPPIEPDGVGQVDHLFRKLRRRLLRRDRPASGSPDYFHVVRDDGVVDSVRRVDAPPAPRVGHGAAARRSYISAFRMDVPVSDVRTPEQWARAIFEGAPGLLRWFIVSGWRFGLGLRLARQPSPSDVLGWRIVGSTTNSATLAAQSRLLSARNIIRCEQQQLTWVTEVDFEGRAGQLLWSVAAPIHHATVPFLLARATRPLQGGIPQGDVS
jgi:hypothetical protein